MKDRRSHTQLAAALCLHWGVPCWLIDLLLLPTAPLRLPSSGGCSYLSRGGRRRSSLLIEHGADATLSRLGGEEVADDVNCRFLTGRRTLFGQFDHRRCSPLHFTHILAALADDATNLTRRHQQFHGQSDVLAGRHETFLSHLLENEVLSLSNDRNGTR